MKDMKEMGNLAHFVESLINCWGCETIEDMDTWKYKTLFSLIILDMDELTFKSYLKENLTFEKTMGALAKKLFDKARKDNEEHLNHQS